MLRYVSRRIKDTVERTSNVLEARRTWTYGNEGVGAFDGNQSSCNENNRFQRHLERRSPNSIFEFGLEPKVPQNQRAVKKRNCRESFCNLQKKFTTSDQTSGSGSSSSDQEYFRERIHRKHHCKFQKSFIDALTWVKLCNLLTSHHGVNNSMSYNYRARH